MRVCETQGRGALMIMIASLVTYGGALFGDWCQLRTAPPHWGDQGPGTMATEVIGTDGADGIYFLPEGLSVAAIPKVIGIEGTIEPTGRSFPAETGYTIRADGQRLNITDMPAVRRLALGLPMDLNRASTEELSQVPGIGETLAAQIVQLREQRGNFASVSDLMAVRGIKEKKLLSLRKYLTVKPGP